MRDDNYYYNNRLPWIIAFSALAFTAFLAGIMVGWLILANVHGV
jgi:hypothetical protein